MPMYQRRIVDTLSFIVAVIVALWLHLTEGFGWFPSIVLGVVCFALLPFITTRIWGTLLLRSVERRANAWAERNRNTPD